MSVSTPGRVNVFLSDPNAREIGLAQVDVPTIESRFAIPGWTGAGGLFDPGTPEFQAGELYVVLHRTYAAWADFFNADFGWQSGARQLPAFPRAGRDLNAYYDRAALRFFFAADKITGQMIYTSESGDVIAHECGHAVLDAHRPDYWDSLLSETAAFHEAFGDISATLMLLGEPTVRAAVLRENDGDLAKSNAVTRLAEQLARGIANAGRSDVVASPDALRDLVNRFRYRDPDKLPGRAPAAKLSSESHSFSRVFSGAFYDVLVGMYEQLRQDDPSSSADAALAQARYDLGHLVAQALTLAPRGDASFKAMATALFNANQQNFASKYFGVLRQAFVRRRVVKAREADVFKVRVPVRHTRTSALAGVASIAPDSPQAMEIVDLRYGEDLPSGYRRPLGVGKQEFRFVAEQRRRDASRVLHFTSPREMELKSKALGAANGARVDVPDALAVHVDRTGRIVSSHLHRADRAHEKRIRDHVEKLVVRGRVYETREGERIDPADLIQQKKPYYIGYDDAGNKRIHRAFIACNF